MKRSNVPSLRIEAASLSSFKTEVARLSSEIAGVNCPHTVVATYWALSSPLAKRELVNGRLVSGEQAKEIAAQYGEMV